MSIYGPPVGDAPWPSSNEAREQLETAHAVSLAESRDRRVHAAVLIAEGFAFGVYTIAAPAIFDLDGLWQYAGIMALPVVLSVVSYPQGRTKTQPRHLRALEFSAMAVTLVLMTVGFMVLAPVDSSHASLWMRLLVAVLCALPMSAVGLFLLGSHRR